MAEYADKREVDAHKARHLAHLRVKIVAIVVATAVAMAFVMANVSLAQAAMANLMMAVIAKIAITLELLNCTDHSFVMDVILQVVGAKCNLKLHNCGGYK